MNPSTRAFRNAALWLGAAGVCAVVAAPHAPSARTPAPAVAASASRTPATPLAGPRAVQSAAPKAAAATVRRADSPAAAGKKSSSPPTPASVAAVGMRAVIDTETGRLRAPLAGEHAPGVAVPTVDARPSRVPEEVRADGTIYTPLDDRFLEYVVAHRAPDGTLRFHCEPATAPMKPAAAPRWEDK